MLRELSLVADGLTFHHISLVSVVVFVAYLIVQRYQKGLSQLPGPFIASLTNFWRVFDVWSRDSHITFRELHERHGDVVRVAPNVLSFGDPNAIADIYGLNKGYTKVSSGNLCANFPMYDLTPRKSGYYDVFATLNRGNIVYNL